MSKKPSGGRSRIPRITAVEVFLYRMASAPAGEEGPRPQYLLLQRETGLWQPACGKIERGETNLQAARREAREESGINPGPVRPAHWVDTFVDPEKGNVYLLPVFLAEVPADAEPETGEEHVAHAWLPLDEALERLPFHGYRESLKAAEAMRQRLEAMKAAGQRIPDEGEAFDRRARTRREPSKEAAEGDANRKRRRRRRRGGRGRGRGGTGKTGGGSGGSGGQGG